MLQLQIKSDFPDIENIQNLIKTAINSEITNLQRFLSKTNQILLKFEEKYQISPDCFINHWTAEDLGLSAIVCDNPRLWIHGILS